ncbi:MAG TPA: hypothetical protein PKV24_20650 [Cyclobacteriaceae bacterium]|nr:hypothetical protein [Cyclobacteriaceae bacterium]
MEIITPVIECPECHKQQEAEIIENGAMLFPTYIHKCIHCGYLIMESEWNAI